MIVSQIVEPTAQSIDFVDKYYASFLYFPGCFEEIAHSFGTNPSKDLDKFRGSGFDERTAGFSGQGSC